MYWIAAYSAGIVIVFSFFGIGSIESANHFIGVMAFIMVLQLDPPK